MNKDLVEEIQGKLASIGIECRYSSYNNNLLIASCIFCQNPNWNLEIELSKKFVYHCWACDSSGTANHLLNKVLKLGIKLPQTTSRTDLHRPVEAHLKDRTNALRMFSQAGNYKDRVDSIKDPEIQAIAKKAIQSQRWKFTTKDRPFRYKKILLPSALICLGLQQCGILVVDTVHRFTFKTRQDLFIYNPNNSPRLCIVEGPFDVWPHFLFEEVLILTQTNLKLEYIDLLLSTMRPHKKELYVCLDKGAEKVFVRRLQQSKAALDRSIYVFQPEKHSPRESGYLLASRIL